MKRPALVVSSLVAVVLAALVGTFAISSHPAAPAAAIAKQTTAGHSFRSAAGPASNPAPIAKTGSHPPTIVAQMATKSAGRMPATNPLGAGAVVGTKPSTAASAASAPVPVVDAPQFIPSVASPMDRPSAAELQTFPGATVTSAVEVAGPGDNQVTRARILATSFKYPNVRTEEVLDASTGAVLVREVMVADHLLVTLADGVTPDAFLAKLGSQAISMERVTPDAPLFRLHLAESSLDALPAALDESSALTGTMAVEPDFVLQANLTPNDPKFLDGTLWELSQPSDSDIDAPEGWAIRNSASSIIVAVIDTGIRYTHQDLAANMWRNPNETAGNGRDDDGNGFVDDIYGCNAYNNNGDPMDDNGHGTHCAGTIGAVGNNGIGITGVAWNVKLMACKFLSSTGAGSTSDAVRCIDYARVKGAKILSNSWGGGGASATLQAAIERARAAGMIFVAAAGNDGRNTDSTPSYPASYPTDNIVSVAATNRLDALSTFSNFGVVTVALGAPGESIYSTVSTSDSSYAIYSGTSMATPHVSGVLALLAAQYPADSYTSLIARLYAGTEKIPSLAGKTKTGGRLNLYKAITGAAPTTPVPPINDGFASATAVSVASWALTGNNTNATAETSEPSHAGSAPAKSIWWAWSAPSSGTGTLCTAGSSFDTVLAVYTGSSVSALTPVASNDNTGNATYSTVSFPAVQGTVYRIAVDGKSGASGTVQLSGNIVVPAGPVNDKFASAATCTGSSFSVTGSNVGASAEVGEPNHAAVSGGKSVWWTWTATSNGTLTVNTAGSTYDTTLAVYTGSAVNALALLGANDDQSSLVRTSIVAVPVVTGTTYRIAVDGYNGATGSIVLSGALAAKVPLVAPAGVSATRDTTGAVTVLWGAVSGATRYEVNIASGSIVYASGFVTGTAARTAGALPKGVVLSAKVRALDATGSTGPWSTIVTVK